MWFLHAFVTKVCVNIFSQKGGGAIFNTVKTKANPAMKTVYKFVSTSLDSFGYWNMSCEVEVNVAVMRLCI